MKQETIVTYKVGEKDFTLAYSLLKPSQSLKFLVFMAKILGAPATKVVGAVQSQAGSVEELMNLKDEDVNFEKIGQAIVSLFERLDEDEMILKLNLLFSSVSLGGASIDVDHFMFDGDPGLVFKVAIKAMEVNYRRFLDGNSGLLSKLTSSLTIIQKSKSLRPEQT